MSKICTSIEQSKKLIESGIDVNTADMMWEDWGLIDEGWVLGIGYYPEIEKDYGKKCYPAWSLSALLDILPETIEDEWGEYDLKIDMKYKKPQYVRLGDCYHSDFPSWDWDNEELLDNIVEAVIWLNNNDYLRNEKLH